MSQGDTSTALQMSLERLAARHFDLSQAEDGLSQSLASRDYHTGISPWDWLTSSCRAQSLLSVLSSFRDADFSPADAMIGNPNADLRANLVNRGIANDSRVKRPADKEDPTLFSKLRQRYQGLLEDLLLQDATNDLRLKEFQIRHNAGHFLCRFKDCPRASEGFDAFDLRQQHEDRHTPRFKCNEPSCGWICKDQRLWKRHMETYHKSTKHAEIPSSMDIPKDLDDRSGASTPTPSTSMTSTTLMQIPPRPSSPTNMDLKGNQFVQDWQMQLMLLEQQNRKRLLMAGQEQEEDRSMLEDVPVIEEESAASGKSKHALQDYQTRLMLLTEQNRKRLWMAPQEQEEDTSIPEDKPNVEEGSASLGNSDSALQGVFIHAGSQDDDTHSMLPHQQRKKRKLAAVAPRKLEETPGTADGHAHLVDGTSL